jgi:hypothetical protein
MATIDLGDANQKLITLRQTLQSLQHMFVVQCYSSGIDPLTIDIDNFDFATVSDALQSMATSLATIKTHITETQEEIGQGPNA